MSRDPRHPGRSRTLGAILFAVVFAPWSTLAFAQPSPEYQLKAVFLYHFTQFVEWPREAFAERDAPFVIGVLGENPFEEYLREAVRDEKVHGRDVAVRHLTATDSLAGVQILYISASERYRERQILDQVKGLPILTVGDSPNFVSAGGTVQFFTDRGRIRLRVNIDSARSSTLNISSRLLGLADIYRGPGRG